MLFFSLKRKWTLCDSAKQVSTCPQAWGWKWTGEPGRGQYQKTQVLAVISNIFLRILYNMGDIEDSSLKF